MAMPFLCLVFLVLLSLSGFWLYAVALTYRKLRLLLDVVDVSDRLA